MFALTRKSVYTERKHDKKDIRMKKTHALTAALIIIIAVFMIAGCTKDDGTTWQIWLDEEPLSDFEETLGVTLDDHLYYCDNLDQADFEQLSGASEDDPVEWTAREIRRNFLKHGLTKDHSTRITEWFTTTEHGFCFFRDGDMMYILVR